MDPLQRPIFVVGTPQSGTSYVFRALGELPGAVALDQSIRNTFDAAEELRPALRGHDTTRRTADDATPEAVQRIRVTLSEVLSREEGTELRFVDGAPRHSLRIPFLDAVFPDAVFVYVYRPPRETIAAMAEAWQSGRYVTHPFLPDWPGPKWSMLLVPGWRELAGKSIAEIATAQWSTATRIMLEDLEALAPDRWAVVDYTALTDDPEAEMQRLAGVLGLEWRDSPEVGSPHSYVLRPSPELVRELDTDLQRLPPMTVGLAETAHSLLAAPASRRPTATPDFEAPARSIHTAGFGRLLDRLDSSLLMTTGATGKLVCARHDGARVNTHFEDAPQARALAASLSEFAWAGGGELRRYRSEPDKGFVAQSPTPAPRASAIEYCGGELWIAADDRLEPAEGEDGRAWRLPFPPETSARWRITGIAAGADEVAYVCADPGSPGEGCIVDRRSGEVVADGLTTPRGLRLADERLWVVERDAGRLSAVDPQSGELDSPIDLPGTPRGLAISGSLAFVALSRVRRPGAAERPDDAPEPFSGISVVDLVRAAPVAFLRFEAEVPEVYDVALLPHRYPEIVSGY